ncbi:hypothetical protein [Franconibacter helveticus]|uniref:hypothetical protein n=1 Tax=Franconibacter helveticus TaxID=357240 RepID=UPI001EF7D6E8|nr:hypothetical protein [Franconibacter helveticus]
MFKKNDGGQVFPTAPTEWSGLNEGMSLRDYFAAQAMCALLSNNSDDAEVRVRNGAKHVAARAYDMADAMMKARDVIATVIYNGKEYKVRQLTPDEWQLTLVGKEREKVMLHRQQMLIAGLGHVVEGDNG